VQIADEHPLALAEHDSLSCKSFVEPFNFLNSQIINFPVSLTLPDSLTQANFIFLFVEVQKFQVLKPGIRKEEKKQFTE
jgi:hypothetical protein